MLRLKKKKLNFLGADFEESLDCYNIKHSHLLGLFYFLVIFEFGHKTLEYFLKTLNKAYVIK